MFTNKKAIVGRYLVILIIALVLLSFLFYRIFIAEEKSFEIVELIKDSLFA